MFGLSLTKTEQALNARMISQHHMTAAMEAIRTSFLANGGALLAAMTFLGEGSAKIEGAAKLLLPLSFIAFSIGIVLSIAAALSMWKLQDDAERWLGNPECYPRPERGHPTIRWILRVALAFFVFGMFLAAGAIYFISGSGA